MGLPTAGLAPFENSIRRPRPRTHYGGGYSAANQGELRVLAGMAVHRHFMQFAGLDGLDHRPMGGADETGGARQSSVGGSSASTVPTSAKSGSSMPGSANAPNAGPDALSRTPSEVTECVTAP